MNRKDLRKQMLKCADEALSPSMVWSRGRQEDEDMIGSIYSVKQLQNIIKKLFRQYESRVPENIVKGRTYYIRVENEALFHPIYLIGTFVVLLLGGVEKIWVEYEKSYLESKRYLKNYVMTFFIEEIVKSFSNMEMVESGKKEQNDRTCIRFVSEHKEIGHVVELGGQAESYERLMSYPDCVTIHTPTTNFIWIDETMENEIEISGLEKLGEKCSLGIMDYECFGPENVPFRFGFEPERTYIDSYSWEEFLREFVEWRVEHRVCGVFPIWYFGKGEIANLDKGEYSNTVWLIKGRKADLSCVYYDFISLFEERS